MSAIGDASLFNKAATPPPLIPSSVKTCSVDTDQLRASAQSFARSTLARHRLVVVAAIPYVSTLAGVDGGFHESPYDIKLGMVVYQETALAIDIRSILSETEYMRGNEFIKRVQKYAKTNGLPCEWHPERGKGSHGSLTMGERFTVVRNPKDELKTGTLHAMLKQLNLKLSDI